MKISTNNPFYKTFFLFFFLFGYVGYAQTPPVIPPPPVDEPIDEHLIVLLFAAVLFGIYIIYNHKINKKRLI